MLARSWVENRVKLKLEPLRVATHEYIVFYCHHPVVDLHTFYRLLLFEELLNLVERTKPSDYSYSWLLGSIVTQNWWFKTLLLNFGSAKSSQVELWHLLRHIDRFFVWPWSWPLLKLALEPIVWFGNAGTKIEKNRFRLLWFLFLLPFPWRHVINLVFLYILDAKRSDWSLNFYFLGHSVILTLLKSPCLRIQIA